MNEPGYRPTAAIALVLSADALSAALFGAAAELAGCAIAFARVGESPRDALTRLRPAAVLIDASDDSACSGSVLGPATMLGSRRIVFGTAAAIAARSAIMDRFRPGVLVMPRDANRLADLLTDAAREHTRA